MSIGVPAQFIACKSQSDLAALLSVSLPRLRFHLYSKNAPSYRHFNIPKANGSPRAISSPPPVILRWQAQIARILADSYIPKPSVHRFVSKRGIVTNAQVHVGQQYVLNIDLDNFFPTIHFGRVKGLFLKPPFSFPPQVAATLAQLCTDNGRLPQGAPTSPAVSNLICRRLDNELARFSSKHKCVYTRYADDITFSSSTAQFPSQIVLSHDLYGSSVTLGSELVHIISKHQFQVNTSKSRVRSSEQRQEVTGLTVNKKVNVSKKYIRRLRAILDGWKVLGYAASESEFLKLDKTRVVRSLGQPTLLLHIRGKLQYLRMVRGDGDLTYIKYALQAARLTHNIDPPVICKAAALIEDFIEESVWVVIGEDSAQNAVAQGSAFFLRGVGFVSALHVIANPASSVKCWFLQSMRAPFFRMPITGYKANPHVDIAILQSAARTFGQLRASDVDASSGDTMTLVGYPNWHSTADRTLIAPATVVQSKVVSTVHFSSVSYPLLSGASGAPALNAAGEVSGVITNSSTHSTIPNAFVAIKHIPLALAGTYVTL